MSKEVGTPRYLSLVVSLKNVGDKAVHKELGDRMEKTATTASSLKVGQGSVIAAKLLTTVRHHLVLPVQVNAAEGVIIMESSIRSDLHLEDAGGIDCLPTATIFEELARIGVKSTAWNEFSSTMASLIICLATSQKFNLITQEEPQQDNSVPTPSNDPPLSGEDSMQLSVDDFIIEEIDKDANVSLVDDTNGRSDDAYMFDANDLHGDEVNVDMTVGEKQEQNAKEREVDTSVEDSVAPITIKKITLAQTLI
ncbi:hypothetical protein Tco_1149186, partial [Tanacetum coccineum]